MAVLALKLLRYVLRGHLSILILVDSLIRGIVLPLILRLNRVSDLRRVHLDSPGLITVHLFLLAWKIVAIWHDWTMGTLQPGWKNVKVRPKI